MDYHENGKINYSEFLAATIDVNNVLTDQRLSAVFHQFDTDSSGMITKEDIFYAMQKLGREVQMEEIEKILKDCDKDGDGGLDLEEFKKIFFDGQSPSQ